MPFYLFRSSLFSNINLYRFLHDIILSVGKSIRWKLHKNILLSIEFSFVFCLCDFFRRLKNKCRYTYDDRHHRRRRLCSGCYCCYFHTLVCVCLNWNSYWCDSSIIVSLVQRSSILTTHTQIQATTTKAIFYFWCTFKAERNVIFI